MTKEVQDRLCKCYLEYEDAKWDVNYSFHEVPCEGSFMPNEARIRLEATEEDLNVIKFKFIKDDEENYDAKVVVEGIFKLKNMKRDTLFGVIIEKVYIFAYHVEEDWNERY